MHSPSTREAGHEGTAVPGSAWVPLLEEQLEVHKRTTGTGRVHVRRRTSEHKRQFDVSLLREDVEVRRVRADRVVDRPEAPRQEGDVMIVPLHEEVVTTRPVLAEELHIRRRQSTVCEPHEVTLRREHIDVTREDLADADPGASGPGAGKR